MVSQRAGTPRRAAARENPAHMLAIAMADRAASSPITLARGCAPALEACVRLAVAARAAARSTRRARADAACAALVAEHGEEPAIRALAHHAHEHGVSVLMAEAMEGCADVERPRAHAERVARVLRQVADADLASALGQVGSLLQAGSALRAAGVDWIGFKGPVIGELAYGSWRRRTAGDDLDLLVAPQALDAAILALVTLGFIPAQRLPRRSRAFALRAYGELPLTRGDGVIIDLHWAVHFPYLASTPRTADLLATRREIALIGAGAARRPPSRPRRP